MTMVFKEASPNHRSRVKGEECMLVLDQTTNECLHYEPLHVFPSKSKIYLDSEKLKQHPKFQLNNNLIDCHINICSLEVTGKLFN